MKPRIKICCISSLEEARMAIEFGASAIGLVGHMPSGPGVISDELIQEIAAATPPPIATFLLTSIINADAIIRHHQRTGTNTIQIVDRVETETLIRLREALPAIKLVQVVHVIDEYSVEEALSVSQYVNALLLDSGNPNLEIKELGGTGRVHNWELSKQIREQADKPVFLAGGINAENAKQAIEIVQPFALDLCSSIRTNGQLDRQKLERFIKAVAY